MTRILFVDDEPRLLAGLRLSLRSKRKIWDMLFLEGGAAALQELEARPVDVIVSDMRMPGMSGAELLARAAVLRPEAARIILSGQMDETAAVRAAAVAHRFLTKPCDSKTLEATIEQTLQTHAWLHSEHLRSRIGTLGTLPSLPQAYLALDRALSDTGASVGDIARIIEDDPAMAAKVLQLVNSSFFGLSRSMAGIAQAVAYLGVSSIKSLALANSLFDCFGKDDVRLAEHEQNRSLLRARIARRLFADPRASDAAATAALLLDVGTLVLRSRLPSECAECQTEATEEAVPIHDVERRRLGVTHAEIGAYLLGLWGLPHDIIEAVANHHADWNGDESMGTATAARLSDSLVSAVAPSAGGTGKGPPAELVSQLGLTENLAAMREELALVAREVS